MRVQTILAMAVMGGLAGCAGKTPPPAITYDNASFKPAVRKQPPPSPPKPPTIPVGTVIGPPEPLRDATPAPAKSPTESVADANSKALYQPTDSRYLNAAQVYPFSENALYRLYTAPEQVSDIALQPGETLSAVSAGDTVRWAVGNTTSGSGANQQVHVLVKPFEAGLKTNLVILTDRRTYHLVLDSTKRISMAAISWRYPDYLIAAKGSNTDPAKAVQPIDSGIALSGIKFRYAVSGDHPPWRPLRAFDDGHKVYIEFPARIDQGEAPPLFVVGPDGGSELVNYRVRGNYYIVDRLFGAAELRLGQGPQQVVRISRTDGKPASRGLF